MTQPIERVEVRRPAGVAGVLSMRGTTSGYAVDPVGEVVVGVVTRGVMRAERAGQRYVCGEDDVCVFDASARHSGRPHSGDSWDARLLILESPSAGGASADESPVHTWRLPGPHVRNRRLSRRFIALHAMLERPSSVLAGETMLIEWLEDLAGRGAPAVPAAGRARRDPGLRAALALLADDPTRNVTLAQLAEVSGVSRHRLHRLFRSAYGLAPHEFQLAQRILLARRFLERGGSVAEAAHQAGFSDQAHLHRHFRRTLGLTPSRYARLFRADVQDAPAISG